MKNIKHKISSAGKKVSSKVKAIKPQPESNEAKLAKITNTTLEQQRQEILKNGKRFKYPVQYSKNKLVINTVIISVSLLVVGIITLWVQLYQVQNTSEFIYRITTVLPLPVARVDGEKVLYSDYLAEYRSNMTISQQKKDVIEGANDTEALSKRFKQQSMKNAIENALAEKLAKENGITVSEKEIDEKFAEQRKAQNIDISENAFYTIISKNYGLSPSEYRRMFIQLPLLKQKVSVLIDKQAEETKNEIVDFLKNNQNDFAKVAEKYGDKVEYGAPGQVRTTNIDGGRTKVALTLNSGEVSKPFISNAGDGYYFVKLIKKTDTEVEYQYIKVKFTEFDKRLEELKKSDKIQQYIKIEEQ